MTYSPFSLINLNNNNNYLSKKNNFKKEIFLNVRSNKSNKTFLKINPLVLCFKKIRIREVFKKKISILNISNNVQKINILPLESSVFNTSFSKPVNLLPGIEFICSITFKTSKLQFHHSILQIICQDEAYTVDLLAYPCNQMLEYSESLIFKPIDIGNSEIQTLNIKSNIPVNIEYKLEHIQPHPSFTLNPNSGIILPNEEILLNVIFKPIQYSVCIMKFQFNILQPRYLDSWTYLIIGQCSPKLLSGDIIKESRTLSSIDLRNNSNSNTNSVKYINSYVNPNSDLNSNKKSLSEIKTKSLKKFNRFKSKSSMSSRQDYNKGNTSENNMLHNPRLIKENEFKQNVQQKNKYRQITLNKPKLGEMPMNKQFYANVLLERKENTINLKNLNYNNKWHNDSVHQNNCNFKANEHLLRNANCKEFECPAFDCTKNNVWETRLDILMKFAEAARKVIIRLRADKRIEKLKNLRIITNVSDENKTTLCFNNKLIPSIEKFKFPIFRKPKEEEFKMIECIEPLKLKFENDIPFFTPKILFQHKLLEYKTFNMLDTFIENYINFDDDSSLDSDIKDFDTTAEDKRNCNNNKSESSIMHIPNFMIDENSNLKKSLKILNPITNCRNHVERQAYIETDANYYANPVPHFSLTNHSRTFNYSEWSNESYQRQNMPNKIELPNNYQLPFLYNFQSNKNCWNDYIDEDLLPQYTLCMRTANPVNMKKDTFCCKEKTISEMFEELKTEIYQKEPNY